MSRFATYLAGVLAAWIAIAPAHADDSTPLLYSRSNIIIQRKAAAPAAQTMPWQKEAETSAPPGLLFEVEVRDGTTLYNQEGWFNLSGMSEKTGVLFAFSAPGQAPIIASSQYAPLDILLVNEEGAITQIMPSIILANLEKEVYPPTPVLAFLLLKGGLCKELGIQPGDEVQYKLFKKAPTVLTTPEAAAAVITPTVPATATQQAVPAGPVIIGSPSPRKPAAAKTTSKTTKKKNTAKKK